MNSLRQILNPDLLTPPQVRRRPRHLQDAVVCPCRELQLLHRFLHQHQPGGVHLAHFAHHAAGHLGIVIDVGVVLKASLLHLPGAGDAGGDVGAGFGRKLVAGQPLIGDGSDLHVQVDAVE